MRTKLLLALALTVPLAAHAQNREDFPLLDSRGEPLEALFLPSGPLTQSGSRFSLGDTREGTLESGVSYRCNAELEADRKTAVGVYRLAPLEANSASRGLREASLGSIVYDKKLGRYVQFNTGSDSMSSTYAYHLTFKHPSGLMHVRCDVTQAESGSLIRGARIGVSDLNHIFGSSARFGYGLTRQMAPESKLKKALSRFGNWVETALTSNTINDRATKNYYESIRDAESSDRYGFGAAR